MASEKVVLFLATDSDVNIGYDAVSVFNGGIKNAKILTKTKILFVTCVGPDNGLNTVHSVSDMR